MGPGAYEPFPRRNLVEQGLDKKVPDSGLLALVVGLVPTPDQHRYEHFRSRWGSARSGSDSPPPAPPHNSARGPQARTDRYPAGPRRIKEQTRERRKTKRTTDRAHPHPEW